MKHASRVAILAAAVAASAMGTATWVLDNRTRRSSRLVPLPPHASYVTEPSEYEAADPEAFRLAVAAGHRAAQACERALTDGNEGMAVRIYREACEAFGRASGRSVRLPSAERAQLVPLLHRLNQLQTDLIEAVE